ncbi:heavy-metal-associated domain-containing protein [Sphingobacterium wenxiniae]|uniref:Copper chaperone n=1 Tax=Sphingobacterium wenxiniae TaxID=683125 RepID=A0A1I6RC92_9SPHI|nr:heavy-metal-associated domain-containing protein [Sphingobacterium wenxiniae]SFS62160.1 copper chaperone [Sphingobacterium wenxiniae]
MENKAFKFKTNINCGGCISTVTPHLDGLDGIEKWEVDTANKDKILTVEASSATAQEIVATVEKAGFKIEPVQV